MKLSVLIPTIPRHSRKLEALLIQLKKQKTDEVEILTYETEEYPSGLSTGKKRNELISEARGEYVVFVDADDVISEDYIETILHATQGTPDIICFDVMYCNGSFKKPVKYSKKFGRDAEKPDYFERLPNHLMPVKRSIAHKVGYKDITYGEDADYAKRIRDRIRSESIINKTLYYYLDESK